MTSTQQKVLAYIVSYLWWATCIVGLLGVKWVWITFIVLTVIFFIILIINVIASTAENAVASPPFLPEWMGITIDTSMAFALLVFGHYILAALILAEIYVCSFLQYTPSTTTT